jgi:hypothetical protein
MLGGERCEDERELFGTCMPRDSSDSDFRLVLYGIVKEKKRRERGGGWGYKRRREERGMLVRWCRRGKGKKERVVQEEGLVRLRRSRDEGRVRLWRRP